MVAVILSVCCLQSLTFFFKVFFCFGHQKCFTQLEWWDLAMANVMPTESCSFPGTKFRKFGKNGNWLPMSESCPQHRPVTQGDRSCSFLIHSIRGGNVTTLNRTGGISLSYGGSANVQDPSRRLTLLTERPEGRLTVGSIHDKNADGKEKANGLKGVLLNINKVKAQDMSTVGT